MEKTPKSNLDLGSGSAWRSVPSVTSLEPTLTSLMLPGIPAGPQLCRRAEVPKTIPFPVRSFVFWEGSGLGGAGKIQQSGTCILRKPGCSQLKIAAISPLYFIATRAHVIIPNFVVVFWLHPKAGASGSPERASHVP